MQTLPLPSLNETLDLFLCRLKPLIDEKQLPAICKSTEDFRHLHAPKLQQLLERRAALAAPDSWLIDFQRQQYLQGRDSLPFASNQTMKIAWKSSQRGLKRVAHFIHALGRVHRDYLLNQLPFSDKSCYQQWEILLGAARRPRANCDLFLFNEDEKEKNRHIIVVFRGRGWMIDILDGKKGIATPAQIENQLFALTQNPISPPDLPFCAPSIAESGLAQEIRAQLISRGRNAEIWQAIEKSLFIISLDDAPIGDDEDGLNGVAFSDNALFWAYKPFNYYCNFRDNHYFLHSEHTWADSETFAEILAMAQVFQKDEHYSRRNHLPDSLNVRSLDWQIDKHEFKNQNGGTQKLIKDALSQYQQRNANYGVSLIDLFLTSQEQTLLKSFDSHAVVQILLQYAQLKTWQMIRSSREAIDMRGFINGRQSFMQTVTETSKALCHIMQHLGSDKETVALMRQYMEEHATRKARCLEGKGIYDHLLGLYSAGLDHVEAQQSFFTDSGFKIFSQHFFATQSLPPECMIDYIVFMPNVSDGVAVNYTLNRNHLNIILTHRRNKMQEIKLFRSALKTALKQILRILNKCLKK